MMDDNVADYKSNIKTHSPPRLYICIVAVCYFIKDAGYPFEITILSRIEHIIPSPICFVPNFAKTDSTHILKGFFIQFSLLCSSYKLISCLIFFSLKILRL